MSHVAVIFLTDLPHVLRLPAFDDSGRGHHHLAIPISMATHLSANHIRTITSPPGCSCAISDGHSAPRRSSAILPPPTARGTTLNKDKCIYSFNSGLHDFSQDSYTHSISKKVFLYWSISYPLVDLLCSACMILPLPPSRAFWTVLMHFHRAAHLSQTRSYIWDHFMLHEYISRLSLWSHSALERRQ